MNIYKVNILNMPVSVLTYRNISNYLEICFKSKQKRYICIAAIHLIMECYLNPSLAEGVKKADLITSDGMPLVWLLKIYGFHKAERIYGPDLMLKICEFAHKRHLNIFILGGSVGMSQQVCIKIQKRFPELRICGAIDTPHRPFYYNENKNILKLLNKSNANIVFVGMGCPYQEEWIIKHRPHIKSQLLIGVGAAFDFISGKRLQAPVILRTIGLEWLFRLIQEPQRLWRRYIIYNTMFLFNITKQILHDILINNQNTYDKLEI